MSECSVQAGDELHSMEYHGQQYTVHFTADAAAVNITESLINMQTFTVTTF
jgi:hypothetical protein